MPGEMVVLEYGPLPFYCCVLLFKKIPGRRFCLHQFPCVNRFDFRYNSWEAEGCVRANP